MYPNMTRSLAECRDALAYVHEVETFSAIDKILVQNVGAVGMSFAHGKIKKKHGISDERAALYARLDEWAQYLKSRREAGSTSVVNLGDLAVYGVLNCARGQRTCARRRGATALGTGHALTRRARAGGARARAAPRDERRAAGRRSAGRP